MLLPLIIVTLSITGDADAFPKRMERMTVSEMKMTKNDLDSAGSRYAYNQQQNHEPVSYVHYTNHGTGHYYDAPMRYYVSVSGVSPPTIPKPKYNPVEIQSEPLVYSLTNQITQNLRPLMKMHRFIMDSNKRAALAPYFLSRDRIGGGENKGEDSLGSMESSGSQQEEYSSEGEKKDEDYKSHLGFDEKEEETYENGEEQGRYKEEGGRQKGHDRTIEEYNEHDEKEKAVTDENHGKSTYRKNGEKSKGYHNVYHKNEYKKNTDFYDNDHVDGHFEKYDSHDRYHNTYEKDHKKGNRHDSAFENDDRKKKGHHAEDRHEKQDKSYERVDGRDSVYQNKSSFNTDDDVKSYKNYEKGN